MEVDRNVIIVLLDTGNEYSLIRESAAKGIRITINPPKNVSPLQGVTGKKLRVLGVRITNIRIGETHLNLQLMVIPDHYLNTTVLLGMDLIGSLEITTDCKRHKVVLNDTT